MARHASLQNRIGGVVIQTPESLYDWCSLNVQNIKSFFVSKSDVEINEEMLQERFKFGKRIPGTQSFHSFVPIDGNRVEARILSISNESKIFVVNSQLSQTENYVEYNDCVIGLKIACVYDFDGLWYIGEIIEKNDNDCDLKIEFLKPNGYEAKNKGFMLSNKDVALVNISHVIKIVTTLKRKSRTAGRNYQIHVSERKEIEKIYSSMMS